MIGLNHQILSLNLSTPGNKAINIDISTHPKNKSLISENVRDYLSKADFELASYFMECDAKDSYLIRSSSPRCEIENIPTKIELLSSDADFFIKKPLSLFRLIKLSFKYPKLPYGENLTKALEHLNTNNPFTVALTETSQPARFSTCLSQLFERFNTEIVLNKMQELHVLSKLTGFSEDNISSIVQSAQAFISKGVSADRQKAHLFYVLSCHYLINNPSKTSFADWPFYKVAQKICPADKLFYGYISNKIRGVELTCFFPPFTELDVMIEQWTQGVTKEYSVEPAEGMAGLTD